MKTLFLVLASSLLTIAAQAKMVQSPLLETYAQVETHRQAAVQQARDATEFLDAATPDDVQSQWFQWPEDQDQDQAPDQSYAPPRSEQPVVRQPLPQQPEDDVMPSPFGALAGPHRRQHREPDVDDEFPGGLLHRRDLQRAPRLPHRDRLLPQPGRCTPAGSRPSTTTRRCPTRCSSTAATRSTAPTRSTNWDVPPRTAACASHPTTPSTCSRWCKYYRPVRTTICVH